ncbi:MAG: universal stress protein [Desulfobacteraceae bacterium]|nr:MAG: universal stress protein [Desulfobacteraceae bacterium]
MKILVGYDGSEAAKAALAVAEKHARAFGGEIFVVSSMEGGPDIPRQEFEKVEGELRYSQSYFLDGEIPCTTRFLVRGMTPGEDLVRFIEENDIDEVVIGIRKRSKVGKLLFGSTAQYIILNAKCPVVTVK